MDEIRGSEITDRRVYLRRRELVAAIVAAAGGAALLQRRAAAQPAAVSIWQAPFEKQHAPVGSGHGSGEQLVSSPR